MKRDHHHYQHHHRHYLRQLKQHHQIHRNAHMSNNNLHVHMYVWLGLYKSLSITGLVFLILMLLVSRMFRGASVRWSEQARSLPQLRNGFLDAVSCGDW